MDLRSQKQHSSSGPSAAAAQRRAAAPFTLTEAAAATLRSILTRSRLTAAAVRIEAGTPGSRTDYRLGLDDVRRPDDTVVESHGVRFRLDAATAECLRGTTIDYIDALHGSGFVFTSGGSGPPRDGDPAE
jgi:iron-sulfur cluster assembly accessory protein